MQADKNSYRIFGKLVSNEDSEFIFEVTSGWDKYYFFGLFKNNQNKLSFETHYSMIGKFVEVKKFKRVNGTVGYGPIFEIVYIED
ncbi:MAG: hypothetical protein SWH54_12710 [Thermodesulfobacteriota bacterium]|nr:hypothetical protein [Thermodesulfobacteriota bacterium]